MIGIDLGSNTFRAIQIDCETGRMIAQYEKIVKTADRLATTGKISEAAVDRIAAAAAEAGSVIDFAGDRINAVTTEAVRRASNGREVLEQIRSRCGINFRIITAQEEAQLTLLAVKRRLEILHLPSDPLFLIDIGGGSTEMIFVNGETRRIASFPIGIVTVAQQYSGIEAISAGLDGLMQDARAFFDEVAGDAPNMWHFTATAGTPTSVAALKLGLNYRTYDPAIVNGTELVGADLQQQLERLLAADIATRQQLVGVGREDLIIAGILIFERFFRLGGFAHAVVVDDGLREGAAFSGCLEAE